MNRKQALKKIRTAYENKELGFQKGAKSCLYYCSDTESHCAIGVLVGKNEDLMSIDGNINYAFKKYELKANSIGSLLAYNKLKEYCGLKAEELVKLQNLHDQIINNRYNSIYEEEFREYLYSL